ncbi:MAG: TlpA family protein disulfide reductase [Sediminibacterium sp.]|nr:TlpA family protein disulfide reductase [Sediminibacterium sp.]
MMRYFFVLLLSVIGSAAFGQEVDSAFIAKTYFPRFAQDTGKLLPDFRLVDEKGRERTMASFRGKILYIDVWETSCKPCIGNFPYAKQLRKRLKAAQIDTLIEFVTVCTGDSKIEWKKKLKEHKPDGVHLYANDTLLLDSWKVNAFPTYILVDPAGRIMCNGLYSPDEAFVDYALYAATKGIKPAQSVWTNLRQYQYFREHKKYTDDAEGKDYTRWYNSVVKELVAFFQWRQKWENR